MSKQKQRPQKYVDGVLMDCSDEDIKQMTADADAVAEQNKQQHADANRRQEPPHGERRTK